jgi:excisionase family DNA binding protein
MADTPLRATEAARQLGITKKQLLEFIRERRIDYVMVNGIAHVPVDSVNNYRATTS